MHDRRRQPPHVRPDGYAGEMHDDDCGENDYVEHLEPAPGERLEGEPLEGPSPLRAWPSGNVRIVAPPGARDEPSGSPPSCEPTPNVTPAKGVRKRGRRKKPKSKRDERAARSASDVLPTALAAEYCHYETSGGLLLAYHRGEVVPAGRRGGKRGTWMWEVKELDRFMRSNPPTRREP